MRAGAGAAIPAFVLESDRGDAPGAARPGDRRVSVAVDAGPVYRVWNRRPDTNHRYTTDPAVRDAMVAAGGVAEGYGPDAVAMCAPR